MSENTANVSRLVPLQEPERPERAGGFLAMPVLSYGFRTFFLLASAWGDLGSVEVHLELMMAALA